MELPPWNRFIVTAGERTSDTGLSGNHEGGDRTSDTGLSGITREEIGPVIPAYPES